MDQQEADKFANELLWCISQLETGIQKQSPTSKQAQEAWKMLKILRSEKAPIVKKRQVMRNAFGDYRKKMKEGEKKSMKAMKHSRFQNSTNCRGHSKSRFFRQSHTKQGAQTHDTESRSLNADLGSLSLTVPGCSYSEQDGEELAVPKENDSVQITPKEKHVFKFIPSENSFVFGFQSDESDIREDDDTAVSNTALVDNVDHIHCQTDAYNGSGDGDLHKNYYRYEKSNNDFCFGFDDAS